MPPESLKNIFENLRTGFIVRDTDLLEKFYSLDTVPCITPQSEISIEDLNVAINRIQQFIKNENKENENIPEVSWEEMMLMTTKEQENE